MNIHSCMLQAFMLMYHVLYRYTCCVFSCTHVFVYGHMSTHGHGIEAGAIGTGATAGDPASALWAVLRPRSCHGRPGYKNYIAPHAGCGVILGTWVWICSDRTGVASQSAQLVWLRSPSRCNWDARDFLELLDVWLMSDSASSQGLPTH